MITKKKYLVNYKDVIKSIVQFELYKTVISQRSSESSESGVLTLPSLDSTVD